MSGQFRIEVAGLRKEFGSRTVLDIDSLTLESGESYALVGPNGSGKSTFLKVLAGVTAQTAGGVDVSGEKDRQTLSVGYMPQKSYVFGFSVFRNVAMALDKRAFTREEMRAKVVGALEAVGMGDFVDARGAGLSGGEAQRVALARMLVRDLDVLLLDEPTASMDIAGTMLVEEALARYRAQTGCLLVTATHAPSQAHRISGQAIMLSGGRVVECGATGRVLSSPVSDEGKEFLSYWAM